MTIYALPRLISRYFAAADCLRLHTTLDYAFFAIYADYRRHATPPLSPDFRHATLMPDATQRTCAGAQRGGKSASAAARHGVRCRGNAMLRKKSARCALCAACMQRERGAYASCAARSAQAKRYADARRTRRGDNVRTNACLAAC